ncbi:cilia- and flagella-associated protein 95-like [Rhinoraja longicauda]
MDSGIDDDDRKGSLTLRSTQKTYDRPVLVCNWYQHREAEPKDYDVDAIPRGKRKNLHRSTYKRFSNLNDGEWMTSTEYFMSQINLKDDYRLREKKPILNIKGTIKDFFERTSGCPEANHYSVVPRHHPDHYKMLLETTYTYDFPPPYHYIPSSEEEPEKITDFRRYNSQFVDTDDYRRWGRNTWLDESGIYPNSDLKRVLYPPSSPFANYLK